MLYKPGLCLAAELCLAVTDTCDQVMEMSKSQLISTSALIILSNT